MRRRRDVVDDGGYQLQHRGSAALQRLVECAPASGALALWCGHRDGRPDEEPAPPVRRGVPAARGPVCTDGREIVYAAVFEALSVEEQTGWVAHEVLHIALRHVQREAALRQRLGDVDAALFNLCADAIVNSALAPLPWLRLPEGAIRLEQVLDQVLERHVPVDVALQTWDVEHLYLAIDDRRPPAPARRSGWRLSRPGDAGADPKARPMSTGVSRSPGNPSHSQTPGSGDRPAPQAPEEDPAGRSASAPREDGPRAARLREIGARQALDFAAQAASSDAGSVALQDEADLARQWRERLLRAQGGDPASSLVRVLLADLQEPPTPWEQVLRTHGARALSPRATLSWSRPSRSYLANQGRAGPHRRMPWEPGVVASRAVPRIALVVDASGSIDERLLERFAREIAALSRRLQAPLVRIVGDCAVRDVRPWAPGASPGLTRQELAPFLAGGGTDFTPLLEEAARHRPDLVIVLTDLDGPARYRPPAPVLWAVPEACAGTPWPFGRRLLLR